MRYFKMNGAGNDFVIFDARAHGALHLSPAQARAIADRKTGVGCDQVIAIERSIRGDAYMRIWNAEGGEVSACGNATRCVGWLLFEEGKDGPLKIETAAGLLKAERVGARTIAVDMGSPLLKWQEIPIARAMDTVRLDYSVRAPDGQWLEGPGAVNMGNPHAVFFVADAETAPVREVGAQVEQDAFFPEGVNVSFAQIVGPDRIRLRTWERGVGLTKACGTGACATAVAAHRAGLAGRAVTIVADGGELGIEWRASDDRVIMTGPVEMEREGELAA
jgi:diaminopimelate epimerase